MAADTELPRDVAPRLLDWMTAQGFDEAQVTLSVDLQDELNLHHDEPSLLRSTEVRKLSLVGLVDGRKASTEMTELGDAAVRRRIAELFADAAAAPQDAANAVSSGQRAQIVKGPQEGDLGILAEKCAELLEFRRRETPLMMVDEGLAAYARNQAHTVTTGDTELLSSVGWYALSAFGTARDGTRVSSFNSAGGNADDLRSAPADALFGIGRMMRDTSRQIEALPVHDKFTGDVVLMPNAVAALLTWLLGQIGDARLIAGNSMYRDAVGDPVASPLLSLQSRFAAPGVVPVSADAFTTPEVEVLQAGRLACLVPSLYGSRKTGLAHVPTAAAGWELAPGTTPLDELIGGVARGALVGRLSMGQPATNGDFSGVVKNSFGLAGGTVTDALSEVMISGNVARMLRDVVAVSRERIDTGELALPWLRIANLHFS